MLTARFESVAPVTCRVVPSSLFILASSVCKSLQYVISTLTQEGEGGRLFRLLCSVVLWGGRNTANRYLWCMWGALTLCGPHCICPSSPQHALSQSILLRLLVALQGCCPKWALHFQHFPGLSCSGSGSRVLHKRTDSVGHAFCDFPGPRSSGDQVLGKCSVPRGPYVLITSLVPTTQFPGCSTRALSQVPCVSPLGSWSQAATLLADVNDQDPGKTWLGTWSLFTVWWRMLSLGPRLPLGFQLWLLLACLSASSGGWAGPHSASSPLVFAQSFVLWVAQASPQAIPQFGLLSHVSR